MTRGTVLERIGELESELHALNAHVAHTDRLATLGTLAAGVAHEANNQLTPALAYAQFLLNSEVTSDGRQQRALRRVVEGIEAAARILGSVLDLAAPGDGSDGSDVREAAERAIGCLGDSWEREGIDLSLDLPEGLRLAISAQSMQQIFLNLLLNARRALAAHGGGTIRITAEEGAFETSIDVIDNGPGIRPEIRDRLFEPFVTAPVTERGSEGGYGLGLAVCRRLTDQAGGRIVVRHPLEGGAAFRIMLPRAMRTSSRPRNEQAA